MENLLGSLTVVRSKRTDSSLRWRRRRKISLSREGVVFIFNGKRRHYKAINRRTSRAEPSRGRVCCSGRGRLLLRANARIDALYLNTQTINRLCSRSLTLSLCEERLREERRASFHSSRPRDEREPPVERSPIERAFPRTLYVVSYRISLSLSLFVYLRLREPPSSLRYR